MSDVVLQVLLILAYLAIGLIAVTFPIYAICVTFLPQEKWESEKERKNRIERLQAKISELTSRLRTEEGASEQIKEEIAKSETELKGTKLRVQCLTARGAVGLPVSYLALSLLMVGVGFYYFDLEYLVGVVVFGFISVFFSAMAVYRLYKTITAVEYAALRPARTVEFEIHYPNDKMSMAVKKGKESELTIIASTDEDDVENLVMYVVFSSELEVGELQVEEPLLHRYFVGEEYTTFILERAFLPKGTSVGFVIPVIPRKTGKHTIYITVCGKGIYKYRTELTLNVVK